jgi:sterol desaturase/sphingolipid hydroxylase (fatty acid hydroxylase superfamily)
MSRKDWRQLTPFYFYSVVATTLAAVSWSGRESGARILLLIAFGLLSWGFVEYFLHRFIFHYDARSDSGRKVLYAAHLSHHENPHATDRIFGRLGMTVPIAASYWLLAWLVTSSWRDASNLFIGVIAGYFFYEWLHFQCHHGKSRLPLLRYLKKYHLLHHHKTPNLRFGVTSPLFDLIFGTFQSVENASPLRGLGRKKLSRR